jgi:hypothetical protein
VLHLRLIILSVGGDVSVDSDALLVTDFVNFKIKSAQSFRVTHKGRMCVRIFIWMSALTCMSIYVYTIFLKKLYFKASCRKTHLFLVLCRQKKTHKRHKLDRKFYVHKLNLISIFVFCRQRIKTWKTLHVLYSPLFIIEKF